MQAKDLKNGLKFKGFSLGWVSILLAFSALSLSSWVFQLNLIQKRSLWLSSKTNNLLCLNRTLSQLESGFFDDQILRLSHQGESINLGNNIQFDIKRWGLLELGELVIGKTGVSDTFHFFFKDLRSMSLTKSLILQENLRPLIISGEARIGGSSLLSKAGFSLSTIETNYPAIEPRNWAKESGQFDKLTSKEIQKWKQALQSLDQSSNRPLSNLKVDFKNHEKIVSVPPWVQKVCDLELTGKVIIASQHPIVLDSSCRFENIIVLAPEVTLSNGFQGCLQIFSEHGIKIEPGVNLSYPSVLLTAGKFEMSQESQIQGTLIGLEESFLSIQKSSLIIGQVFCLGELELKGKILGCSVVNNLIHRGERGQYSPCLVDGKFMPLTYPPGFSKTTFIRSYGIQKII